MSTVTATRSLPDRMQSARVTSTRVTMSSLAAQRVNRRHQKCQCGRRDRAGPNGPRSVELFHNSEVTYVATHLVVACHALSLGKLATAEARVTLNWR